MGIIQIACGALKLGRFVRLIPQPVMFGFVNGLAIVIFMAQFPMFTESPTTPGAPWLTGGALFVMAALVLLTMSISFFLPKLTKAVPASLVGIIVVSLIVILGGVDTLTVGNMASIKGGLPEFVQFTIPLNMDTLMFIAPYSFILAAVGLIESLMTLTLIDELTETRGQSNRECVGQGVANIGTGFFGGMGGCAMIGQSLINIKSGGRGRTSGLVAASALTVFILVGGPVIGAIPIAALVGVMFMVVIGTFEWASFSTVGKVPVSEIFVILVVTLVTVFMHNLALAVGAGVGVSALVFAWESAQHVRLNPLDREDGSRIYNLQGVLYFGSVREFSERMSPSTDPDDVIIDFKDARVADYSSMEALNALTERYRKAGKRLRLRHLSPECQKLITTAGPLVKVEVADDDPHYNVAKLCAVACGVSLLLLPARVKPVERPGTEKHTQTENRMQHGRFQQGKGRVRGVAAKEPRTGRRSGNTVGHKEQPQHQQHGR